MREAVDLRDAPGLVPAYVALRNRWVEPLLTEPVTEEGTRAWLDAARGEIRCLVEDGRLLGAAILYPERDGEVAFFVAEPGRGVGPELLGCAEVAARARGLASVRADVLADNERARRAFLKAGYAPAGGRRRTWRGREVEVVAFRKALAPARVGPVPATGGCGS